LKIFFYITSKPNSIKLGTNYPLVKGIQFCANKWPIPPQRGDNHKNVKMGWGLFKISSSNLAKVTQVSDVAHGPLVFVHAFRYLYDI
jgi:hypothetical protein